MSRPTRLTRLTRRAKIVATIGPASSDPRILSLLLRAGVDVVRLNLSHGTAEQHRAVIRGVREIAKRLDRYVAVVADLMGPRYRLGEVPAGMTLKRRQEVTLGFGADLVLDDSDLLQHVRAGERLLIDNGLVELEVLGKARGRLRARVVVGGPVSTKKGINLPDSDLPFEISDKDRRDVEMAVEESADYIAASYVGSAADVQAIQKLVLSAGGDLPVIAKLERARAVKHIDSIVAQADAVMVARGDLGVELPLDEVPVLQKRMIDSGWLHGKPVIVATQMLESMMEHPRPTRAESSDVANAVFDGADALMLSGETAAGRYPVEAVKTMVRIIVQAENHLIAGRSRSTELNGIARSGFFDLDPPALAGGREIAETIAAAAVQSSRDLGARCIVALTQGGYTVRSLAMRRPSTPVVALTQNPSTARRLQLVWGVRPLEMHGEVKHHDEVVGLVDRHLLAARLAKPGDRVAILMGDPIQERPPTNLLRLHRVRRE